MTDPADWKLKLRYGQTETDFQHYAMVADGEVVEANDEFGTVPGPAVLSMKCWATDTDEAADMLIAIGNHFGFKLAGKVELFVTEPDAPPQDKPHGYDLNFTPYDGAGVTLQ